MILVDTSVWIDFFRRSPGPAGSELRRMIEGEEPFALTGIVVVEILQGLRRDVARIQGFLGRWDILEPAGFSTYCEAAAISRPARSSGLTLGTIDSLIVAIALESRATLFSIDQDFSRLASLVPLRLYTAP